MAEIQTTGRIWAENRVKKDHDRFLLFSLLALTASILGIASDFVLGFVSPGDLGKYGIIQEGWAEISLWRPGVSMLLAAVAFPLYLFGIHVIFVRMATSIPRISGIFLVLSVLSSAGWLLSHVFFCFPQYVFAYLNQNGYPELALELSDRLLWMLFPALLVFLLLMVSSLGFLFFCLIFGKTVYPRFLAWISPISAAVVLMILKVIFPQSDFVFALMTSSVHVGMFFLFGYVVLYEASVLKNGEISDASSHI